MKAVDQELRYKNPFPKNRKSVTAYKVASNVSTRTSHRKKWLNRETHNTLYKNVAKHVDIFKKSKVNNICSINQTDKTWFSKAI